MNGAAVTVRDLVTLEELRACVSFQQAIWGEDFSDQVPVSILKVTRRIGGVVAGAFDARDDLVGFVFGMSGVTASGPVHWSDMLAVKDGLRDRGVGRLLKEYQRSRCLEAGIPRMRWTFDPLEARNAYLNLGRLGAVVPDYEKDMYGEGDSTLHRGLGTDRFVALWELDAPRTRERLEGEAPLPAMVDVVHLPHAFEVDDSSYLPRPGTQARVPDADRFLVPVPNDIQGMKDRDPGLAFTWRAATRAALCPALDGGGEVRELVRGAGAVSYYVVVQGPEAEDKNGSKA